MPIAVDLGPTGNVLFAMFSLVIFHFTGLWFMLCVTRNEYW